MLAEITPLILAYNEEPNIGRTLEALRWARDIVVVDSFSDDATVEIARAFPAVRVFQRRFDSHQQQWSFGLGETGIATPWVLALDADYIVPANLIDEVARLRPAANVAGYLADFEYKVFGRTLRGTVYPPVAVLYRKSAASYVQDGHTQRLRLEGDTLRLRNRIAHDDRKPLRRWIAAQDRYMALEATKLRSTPISRLSLPDQLRRTIVFAAPAMFLYCLFGKRCLLDGRAGLYYALQRTAAELILSLHLLDNVLRRKDD